MSNRQQAFYQRQRDKGLKRIALWVPEHQEAEIRALVDTLKRESKASEHGDDLPSFLKPQAG